MKSLLFLALIVSCALAQDREISDTEKMVPFGKHVTNKAARDLSEKIKGVYKAEGESKAFALLDREGQQFMTKGTAIERFDFLKDIHRQALYSANAGDEAWSGKLLAWIYNYSRYQGGDYWYKAVISPLHEHCISVGNYSRAREILNHEVNRISEGHGTDIEIHRMKQSGPALEKFPEFKKRLMPMNLGHWQNHDFLSLLARQDLMEGKWRRALEEADVAKRKASWTAKWYADRPNLRDSENMVDNMTDLYRKAASVSADVYHFLDVLELELNEFNSLLQFRKSCGWEGQYVDMAEARVHYLKCILGNEKPEVALNFLTKMRSQISKDYKSSQDDQNLILLFIGDIHFTGGQGEKGWEILDQLWSDSGLTPRSRFLTNKEWCRHRVREGKLERVEPQLLKLLETARQGGVKREEIDLYEIYAAFLLKSGRYEDALQIQRELLRLLKSFDVFTRLPKAYRQLAEIYATMGQASAAKDAMRSASAVLADRKVPWNFKKRVQDMLAVPLPESKKEEKVMKNPTDLQPRSAMVIPLAGLPSRGLFTIRNLSGQQQGGKLTLRGKSLSADFQAEQGLVTVTVSAENGKSEVNLNLQIPEGSSTYIDLSLVGGKEAEVDLHWQPKQGDAIQANWKSETAEEGFSLAIVDAAEYLKNPFYLIPMYHLIQYKDSFEQAMDMRVIASQPARVEIYDQDDKIVAVDANGDGDFRGSGDLIVQDFNRNELPDIKLGKNNQEQRFRYFVRLFGKIPSKGATFSLEIKQGGEWVRISQDRLLAE